MQDAPPPTPAPPVPPLLPFEDPWQLKTRPSTLEGAVTPGEIVSLNHIRDMTGQRNMYLVRDATKLSCSADHVDGFKKYLSNLAYLIDQEGDRFDIDFEWTSPMSGRAGRFFRLNGLKKEQGLATFLYGSLLRQLAHQGVQDLLGLSPGSSALPPDSDAAAAAVAAAVTQLRQAAGVYEFTADTLLPPVFSSLGKIDRPVEVMAPCSSAMCLLCLAEAQALTAFRAAQKGSSAAVVAALQAGAAELYERAAKTIKSHSGDYTTVSDRLKRYVAICASLATARALKVLATDLHSQLQAGPAERAMLEAQQLLATCMAAAAAADTDGAWRGVLQQEVADVESKKKPIESDRLIVYCQPLPREAPPLPAAKVLVSPLPYSIERITSTTAELAMNV